MSVRKQQGFTIVELMIATAVFSTVLLVILTAVTQVGKMYYKGITNAKTQEASRTILDRIAQEIEYSGNTSGAPVTASGTTNGVKMLCIGDSRYMYRINQIVSSTNHGVWYDRGGSFGAGCSTAIADNVNMATAVPTISGVATTNGSELLASNMRLTTDIAPTSGVNGLYTITVMVVYGENDLVIAADGTALTAANGSTAECRGSTIGTQFCAISKLSTTVLKRVQ